jgi:transposase InsO family protein
MTWKVTNIMSQRKEFCMQACQPNANIRELCRNHGISPRTAYKWIGRWKDSGEEGLADLARTPVHSPAQTDCQMEQAVLEVRKKNPEWGGRKIRRKLLDNGMALAPAASTITRILHRNDKIDPRESLLHKPCQRFEAGAPNELLQMDFKGHRPMSEGGRCHPLVVLDDRSRFCLCLDPCLNETTETVRLCLMEMFRTYGLPQRILCDNGSPWGTAAYKPTWTVLTVWFARLGIRTSHGRASHPQTQGKVERFNGTFKKELLRRAQLTNIAHCKQLFQEWRSVYNLERPHEALALATPASVYRPSQRPYPETLPPVDYDSADIVRRVQKEGWISFQGYLCHVGDAFVGQPVALRPSPDDGVFDVFFCQHPIAQIDLRAARDSAERAIQSQAPRPLAKEDFQ